MADDAIRLVFSIFSRALFSSEAERQANLEQSASLYRVLLARVLVPALGNAGVYSNLLSALAERMNNAQHPDYAGKLPALSEEGTSFFIGWFENRTSDEQRQEAGWALCAALQFETERIGSPLGQLDSSSPLGEIYVQYALFASNVLREIDRHSAPVGEMSARLSILAGEMTAAKQTIEQLAIDRAALGAEIAKANSSVRDLNLAIANANAQISDQLSESIAAADRRIDHYVDSVRAKSQFENLKVYWFKRADQARRALIVTWGILLVLLVILPVIAIYKNDSVLNLLAHISEVATIKLPADAGTAAITVATISRLILVTIPLALYFWLIRIVVRFQVRSMLLMDDAGNRATILDTYYRMIEDGKAAVDDRALILAALCRPSPGHGADNIDPPNFTELVDKAMGKG